MLELGSAAPDAPGYDLLALLTGSEGLLGVITEVTVRLIPRPECARVVLAAFDDLAKAGRAVADVIAAGIIPAGLEMMDRPAIAAVEPFVHAGYPLDAEAILLCESDGTPEEVAEEILRMEAVMRGAGATECRVSRDEAERLRFWAGRKAAFPAMGALSPDYYCMDGSIPRKRLAAVLQAIRAWRASTACAAPTSFTPATATCIRSSSSTATFPDEVARAEAFGSEILELCVREGGSITGEHGVGMEKIDQMCVQFGDA